MPLLANRARRVVLSKHHHYLTKSTVIDSAIVYICAWEKSYVAAIDAIRHPVDSDGSLLPHHPLAGG
jgi:hypothetical protein